MTGRRRASRRARGGERESMRIIFAFAIIAAMSAPSCVSSWLGIKVMLAIGWNARIPAGPGCAVPVAAVAGK